jgi:tetratricopeptide (TPR) repeat protein
MGPAALRFLLLQSVLLAQVPAPDPSGGARSDPGALRLASEGRAALEKEDPLVALDRFRLLRALAPEDPQGLLGLGEAHLMLGEPEIGRRYALAARTRGADPALAASLEVRCLVRARDFEGAVTAAASALARPGAGDCVELLAAYGSALFRCQRVEEAARVYLKVQELRPDHAEAHLRLGSGLLPPAAVVIGPGLEAAAQALRARDLAGGIERLQAVLQDEPRHPVAHRLLGEALYQREAEAGMAWHAPEFARLRDALPRAEVDGRSLREFAPRFEELPGDRQQVAARALLLFGSRLPRLLAIGGRHDLLLDLERTTDSPERASLRGKRTFDGRVWDDVRGMGGLRAATGIECLEEVLQFGFDTLSHEVAHQAHLYAFAPVDRMRVRELYEACRKEDRFLDYYAGSNEAEYFGQGIEAFVSYGKRPGREVTHSHTRFELLRVDPRLHALIERLVDEDPLRDHARRAPILRAAIDVALRCGRADDAVSAATLLDAGPEADELRERARRAALLARSW